MIPVHVTPAQVRENGDPMRFLHWPVQDSRALFESVSGRGKLMVMGAGIALYAIAQRDPGLQEAISDASPPPHNTFVRVVEEFGNARSVRPVAMMVFLGSLPSGDARFQDAAFTSLEAIVLSNLLTNVLKGAFGRSRPYQGEGSSSFNPFSGNTSFPSGHSTTAFAFTTPWLLYYPNAFTIGLVALSAGTALSRVATDVHWLSDVLAGSSIGFATAYVLTWSHIDDGVLRISPNVSSEGAGVTVTVRP